jgi:pimeloyl-ACP methyl ester carboxylesterase
MVSRRTRYARHDGLRIAYEIRRARFRKRPWMVLIQGLGFDRTGWAPVVDGLSQSFALLLVDNRGSGRSDDPGRRLAVAEMAQDVVAVLDSAGVPRAHVVGASLGGMIAQEIAMADGDRVGSLVLACTTPGWPIAYPMPKETMRLFAATGRMSADVALRRHVENALSPDTVRDRPEVVERLVAHQRDRHGGAAGFSAQLGAGARFGTVRQGSITAPTLVMHGTADRVVDPRNARLLAERIPGARLMLLPGLGHMFFWEAPGRFTEAVTRFALSPAPVPVTPSHSRKDPS